MPGLTAACIPTRIAFSTSSNVNPSITISRTLFIPASISVFSTRLAKVGQYSSFVEAINALYLDPTLLPLLTTPLGKGSIIFEMHRIAFTADFAAFKAVF